MCIIFICFLLLSIIIFVFMRQSNFSIFFYSLVVYIELLYNLEYTCIPGSNTAVTHRLFKHRSLREGREATWINLLNSYSIYSLILYREISISSNNVYFLKHTKASIISIVPDFAQIYCQICKVISFHIGSWR